LCIHSSVLDFEVNLYCPAILSFARFAAQGDLRLFILKLRFYFPAHFLNFFASKGLGQATYFFISKCLLAFLNCFAMSHNHLQFT
jgi:hypothetical protein